MAVVSIGIENNNNMPALIFMSGMIGLLLGLMIGNKNSSGQPQIINIRLKLKKRNQHNRMLLLFVAFITLGVIYHYAVGGMPIFSPNIITDRFDNNTSGLFGLPGRINLFGTYFAFFLAAISFLSTGDLKTKRIAIYSAVLLLVSLALGGNKGNIIQFIAAVIFLSPYATKPINSYIQIKHKGFNLKYYILGAAIAVLFYTSVSSVHMSAGDRLYGSASEAIIKRIFEISGQAFYVVATELIENEGYGYGKYLLNDMVAFLSNLGIVSGGGFTTTQIASSYVTGRALDAGLFLVPVTITSNGYFLVEFGYFGPIVFSTVLGVIMSYLYYAPLMTKNITYRAFFIFAQAFVFWFVTKGSLGYYGPNMLIMAVFFFVLLTTISSLMTKGFIK